MSRPAVVGILGQRVRAGVAAEIGYGPRELDSYPSACLDALLEAGMVPVGIASLDELDEVRCCDLVDAIVLDSAGRCADNGPEAADARFQRAVLREALRRGRPVLSICRAFPVLAEALADGVGEPAGPVPEPAGPRRVEVGDAELGELLGPRLVVTVPHPDRRLAPTDGLVVAATSAGGAVEALTGVGRPILAISWHPEASAPGEPAREGPFRWLRGRIDRND